MIRSAAFGLVNSSVPGLGYLLLGEGLWRAAKAQIVFLILFFSGIGIPLAVLWCLYVGYDAYTIASNN